MKKNTKRTLIVAVLIGFLIFLSQGIESTWAKDPDYPTKPITFYVGYAAGGMTDVAVRALAEPASKQLGQPIVVVNKPGGSTTLATMAILNAKPDGYTIGSVSGTNALTMPHTEDSPYKDIKGFTFICNYSKFIMPATVRSDAPFKTWKEFIEWARKNPRAAKIGLPGGRANTPQGIVLWQVEQKEGVEFTHIPFKGSADSLAASLGGHIMMDTSGIDPSRMPYLQDGKLRLLAYLSEEKLIGYDAPSFHEMYGIFFPSVMGIWGPAGIPKEVVQKLETAFLAATKDRNFLNVLSRLYWPVVWKSGAQLSKEVNDLYPRVGEVMKRLRELDAKEKK